MTHSRNPASSSIATEAADWYARLRAQDVSELEAVRFRAWRAGDPARRREFEAIDAFWDDLAMIENSPEVLRVRAEISARRRRKGTGRHRALWAVAATLVVAVTGAWLVWQQWSADRYVTNIGEQRTVSLPDGSLIMLNTATEVRLHYSQTKRGMELIRGQANFEVAKDPSRPFIVTAGGGEVQALGTVFNVYKSAAKVTVTLIEGKVAVTPSVAKSNDGDESSVTTKTNAPTAAEMTRYSQIVLAAGEQLSYSTTIGSDRRSPADVPRVTAWRARKLDFSNTPILEAIAEANRYSRDQIVLEAPELKDARISGSFDAGKNELFVEGLKTYFHLDVARSTENRIVLRPLPK